MIEYRVAAHRALRRVAEAPLDAAAGRRSRGSARRLLPLHERELSRVWEAGQIPAAALVTVDGTPLQVVYRGRPNAGSGPDFRDAVLALPDARLLRGDIELHVVASDFHRHGHDRDPAYGRVILHLVYRADAGASTPLPGGRQAPVVALEAWLNARAAQIETMLTQPALWREPCQSAIERMGDDAVEQTLARLGERRLRAKAAALQRHEAPLALYDALLRTLGHGPQRAAWVELGRRVPVGVIDRVTALNQTNGPQEDGAQSLEALFLGAAGLLPALELSAISEDRPYLIQAWQRWRTHGAPRPVGIAASRPSRPANHPARRLAGLARLLNRGPGALLAGARAALLTNRAPAAALLKLLTVEADGAWGERLLPWSPTASSQPALIGRGKAIELAVNALLPVLLAEAERSGRLLLSEAVLGAFHELPSPPAYGRTAHLYRALTIAGGSLIKGADRSQGALHLYAHYCTRGGCGRCPLS